MPSVHGGAIVASVIPSPPLGTDAVADRPTGLGAAAGVGPDRAAAARRFRFELAAHPGSPAQARRLTRARLTHWSVGEDTCDSAALVVSELVTNAIVHTASRRVVCELHDGDDLVRIAVRDEGCAPGEPHSSPQRPEEEQGRGLLLVDALCHSWGAHEHGPGPGLLVWAELPRKGDTPRDDADVPRNDLGWGARPKPGPTGGPGEEDEAEAHHGTAAVVAPRPSMRPASEETTHHRALPDAEARPHGTWAMRTPPTERSRDRGRQ
ncbi:ATP-binding protein [Streptomyces sp. NPDC058676]|uniref:ATP-binding protein n=1 Tax=unclassified Streptomyces TaxID=2593676 RepID=UPI00364A055D